MQGKKRFPTGRVLWEIGRLTLAFWGHNFGTKIGTCVARAQRLVRSRDHTGSLQFEVERGSCVFVCASCRLSFGGDKHHTLQTSSSATKATQEMAKMLMAKFKPRAMPKMELQPSDKKFAASGGNKGARMLLDHTIV